jgi:hypothetical protein
MTREEPEKISNDKGISTKAPPKGIRKVSDTYRALFRWFKEEQTNVNTMAIIELIILTGFQTYDIWYSQHSLYFDASNNNNTITIINGGSELAYITDAYIKIDGETLKLALPSNDSWVIKSHEKKRLSIYYPQLIVRRDYKEGYIAIDYLYRGRKETVAQGCTLFFEPSNEVKVIIKH